MLRSVKTAVRSPRWQQTGSKAPLEQDGLQIPSSFLAKKPGRSDTSDVVEVVGARRGSGEQPNAVQRLIWSTARGGLPLEKRRRSRRRRHPYATPPPRPKQPGVSAPRGRLAAGIFGQSGLPIRLAKVRPLRAPRRAACRKECPGRTESERPALPAGGGARPTSAARFRCPGVAPAAAPEAWPTSPPTRTRGRRARTPTSACARTPRSRRPGVCGARRRATSRRRP